MDQCHRTDPPYAAGEREMAGAFLDWQRDTLLCKVAGLSDEALRRPHEPSGLTLLGIVKHLAAVEMHWFQARFAGETETEIPFPVDWDASWRIEPHETTGDILDLYCRQVDRSRAIAAAAPLVNQGREPGRHQGLTLRWVLLHMIEETARHNGHADLIREEIDGQTGE